MSLEMFVIVLYIVTIVEADEHLDKVLSSMVDKINAMQNQFDRLNSRQSFLEFEVARLNSEKMSLLKKIDHIEQQNNRLTEKHSALESKFDGFQEQCKSILWPENTLSMGLNRSQFYNESLLKSVSSSNENMKQLFPHKRHLEVASIHTAFYSLLHAPVTDPYENQRINFTTVLTNKGNAYNNTTSNFICSVAGTYVFSVTTVTFPDKDIATDIVLNETPVGYLVAGSEGRYDSGSAVIVLVLRENDSLWVRVHGNYNDKGNVLYPNLTSFSGVLISTI